MAWQGTARGRWTYRLGSSTQHRHGKEVSPRDLEPVDNEADEAASAVGGGGLNPFLARHRARLATGLASE